jgi:hypothetical protein
MSEELEEKLDRLREELEENYSPPVINFAIQCIEGLLEFMAEQNEMSEETREEILYCIHRMLSWTAEYQGKDL